MQRCRSKQVQYTLADLQGSTITDELVHGAAFSDVVLQSIDELLVRGHTVHVRNKGIMTDKELS